MKSLFNIGILIVVALSASSCFDKEKGNYQYFPNMYEPVGYEAYGEYEVFENGQEAKIPAEGSIARGWKPYAYENSNDGLASAKEELENPLPYTEDNVIEGKELYTIYCAICHGDKGDGKGQLVEREKILGIPSYNDEGRAITEGSVYHVMYYGINTMGSYASQTSEEERWKINHYVMDLKRELDGEPKREYVKEGEEVEEERINKEVDAVKEREVITSNEEENN